MNLLESMAMGLSIGLPIMLLQLYLYYKERRHKKSLWSTWSELQTELAKVLHRPHPENAPLDRLLEKLETFTAAGISTISADDRKKLTIKLRQMMDDPDTPRIDRSRAEFLLMAMPRAEQEQRQS